MYRQNPYYVQRESLGDILLKWLIRFILLGIIVLVSVIVLKNPDSPFKEFIKPEDVPYLPFIPREIQAPHEFREETDAPGGMGSVAVLFIALGLACLIYVAVVYQVGKADREKKKNPETLRDQLFSKYPKKISGKAQDLATNAKEKIQEKMDTKADDNIKKKRGWKMFNRRGGAD